MSRVFALALAACGAIAGWSVSVLWWLAIEARGTADIAHWLIILLLTVLGAALVVRWKPRTLAKLAACTALAMLLAVLLGPSSSMTRAHRIEKLLTSPLFAYPPTIYAIAGVVGVAVGLWLDQIRACIQRVNEFGGPSRRRNEKVRPSEPDERESEDRL
ncbi:MAG: hypothetical protein NUV77_26775 [Thermoguttaceae bacterium]|jgi:hypothetical protein|nr:hypothetical protein [Thermoguttaceae bacterium]